MYTEQARNIISLTILLDANQQEYQKVPEKVHPSLVGRCRGSCNETECERGNVSKLLGANFGWKKNKQKAKGEKSRLEQITRELSKQIALIGRDANFRSAGSRDFNQEFFLRDSISSKVLVHAGRVYFHPSESICVESLKCGEFERQTGFYALWSAKSHLKFEKCVSMELASWSQLHSGLHMENFHSASFNFISSLDPSYPQRSSRFVLFAHVREVQSEALWIQKSTPWGEDEQILLVQQLNLNLTLRWAVYTFVLLTSFINQTAGSRSASTFR